MLLSSLKPYQKQRIEYCAPLSRWEKRKEKKKEKKRSPQKNDDGVVKNANASKKKIENKETNDVQKKMVFVSDGIW